MALWATALLLISTPKDFPVWDRHLDSLRDHRCKDLLG
jgi:hypothetical protein